MDPEGSKSSHEGEARKERKAQKIPFFKLFAFSDARDYVLMALGSVSACVHGASVPVFLIFFGKLIDVAAVGSSNPASVSHKVGEYALDFVYLGFGILVSAWIEVACWMHTGERQVSKIRLAYLRAMLNQEIGVFDTEASTAEVIASITNDIIVIQEAISEKAGNFLHFMTRFIVGTAIGFSYVWQVSLVTLSVVPLIAIFGGTYVYVATGLIAKVRKSYVKAGEIAEEVIGNVRTVQAFVGEEKAVKSYKNALLETYKYGTKAGLARGLGIGSTYFVLFSSWALVLWYSSVTVHKGISNGGEAFATMMNVVVAGLSLGQAAPSVSIIIRARTVAHPIFEMIKRQAAAKARCSTGKTLPKVDGHIQFSNVSFSYPSRPFALVLDEFNLDIPSGKIVALVGGSGSGKSTVISLIERFYEPLYGAILLDGCSIKDLELRWLRQQIGLVSQEPVLFATSILENILYGKYDATDDEITDALRLSGALDFIENLPDGYETQVGERGIQLSGGQKQRIAISRAMLKNPAILLLDEATSALDAESEKSLQEALDRIMVGRTTVLVAHRLSTVRNADIITVFKAGKIVEAGTHEELIADPQGAYFSLARLPEQQPFHLENVTAERTLSMRSSLELSGRWTSLGVSFHSEGDSISRCNPDADGLPKVRPVSMRRLYSMASPDWIFALFGTISAFIVGIQVPLFALGITQALVAFYMDWETTQREIRKLVILFCGGAILAIFSHSAEHLSFGVLGQRLTLRVRERMFAAMLRNEMGWFDNMRNTCSMLSSRLEADATLLQTIVVDRSSILLQNAGMSVASIVIAFILNWRITLVVLATYPFTVTGYMSEKLFLRGFGLNLSEAYLKANTLAAEAASNIRTVAAFCLEEKVVELYARELKEPSKGSFRRGQTAGLFCGLSQCFLYSTFGLALWYGSVLMGKGLASFGSVIKSFLVLMVTAAVTGDTVGLAPDIMKGNKMASSVFEVIDRKTEMDGDIGEDVGMVTGEIELRRVEFHYPSRPDVQVFKDFNLRIKAGKSMALVGTSGSGKSTVLSLILRFYDPIAGNVMIDGKDIKKLRLKSLRKHIGLVQQEPALFATTINENISYGKDGATEAEVVEAAKLANAHSFISALPDGYSTEVGDRGVQLSGGQKQRVAIARAIIRNPAILLLDEATSALDVESERIVQQALETVMKDRTTVVVAHRLSTIQSADIISVLQEGKIVEQGKHSSLLEKENGAYYKLINLQQQQ
ncbi:ABC transporter B family member 2-like [Phoenix dactylifera]|uniref:ABC transporter B family member 2-like n=1 Tax=Phoenix dactylifera TaxID=42345 RepID=A0A8B7BHY5_PHODC|nr:ABC transporter B family member 2-like [Phoenix dactylifera]